MKDYIDERTIEVAKYIIGNNATVRQAAAVMGISKSTVHIDVTKRLSEIAPLLAKDVNDVLQCNKSIRHIRGGEATREKYLHIKGKK